MLPRRIFLGLFFFLIVSGVACTPAPSDTVTVAPGVLFRRDKEAGIQLLDIDLQAASVIPTVVAQNIERRKNNFIGDCKTVREWAQVYNAVGGINGGYFGDMYDQLGRRKQLVGLAAVAGRVVAPCAFVESTRYPGQKFLRSAIGFTRGGIPEITYATAALRGPMRRYDSPVNPASMDVWGPHSAVSCGPRLFAFGVRRIADKEERLVSPGKLARTFVAYDRGDGDTPRHFVMGRADAMEFADVADFLTTYFNRVHESRPQEAMCLDGGPSSQLVYKNNVGLEDAEPTGVLVPTAILLVPRSVAN